MFMLNSLCLIAIQVSGVLAKGGCGVSACDTDMFKKNVANFAYHVPNLNQLPLTAWSTLLNPVGANRMMTLNQASGITNIVKYGGFCSGGQKQVFFKGSFVPVGIPKPSWIAKIPAGDLDINGNLKVGSYKLDITATDLLTLNKAATACQNICKNTLNCKYASYGWEAPGGWFCKMWTNVICTDTIINWWKPAPPALPVVFGGVPPPTTGFGGGCRVTDTIAKTTALLQPGISLRISPTTPRLATLPYLNTASYTAVDGIVASIKCDITAAGTTPGWPAFGVAWI
jgi:hypothetical protein